MAAAADLLPQRRQPILPSLYRVLRSQSVFDEKELAARSQDAPHLVQRTDRIRNRAQGPSSHNGVDAVILDRDGLG